ncbi:hypothetical protein AB6H26_01255 [Providencia hangzhouensis]|uniref:hypothetical protein n=1 Tax=Providencia hangzhouensis TaxID=3031799 RepID=UPI0034DDB9B2
MTLPTVRATYQSRKTGQHVVVLGVTRAKGTSKRNPFCVWEVGIVVHQGEEYVYSEIPLAWFSAIYEKVSDVSHLPEDITLIKPAGRLAYTEVNLYEK